MMPKTAAERLAAFVASAEVPSEARRAAARALLDTVGVMLAGSAEPAGVRVQHVVRTDAAAPVATVIGTAMRTSPALAALANGTAAHALDYDDMCFVSLAHPSAPLVAAALAAGESAAAPATRLLDGYAIGFEIEALLGRALNPGHYQRGWHCTSTLGTMGAAACAARILGLDLRDTVHALAIAASEASGLKENFGTMTKPLHAGLAARNAITAASLARAGVTASSAAIDGPQGLLIAMAGRPQGAAPTTETVGRTEGVAPATESAGLPQGAAPSTATTGSETREPSAHTLEADLARLGTRWEILETGITVKLYPSCAGTHPALDAMLALRARHGFTADTVKSVVATVDTITPTVLLYDRPTTGLEGKFSMPFCLAAAIVDGRVDLDTFEPGRVADPAIQRLLPSITMRVDAEIGKGAPPLTQARLEVQLRDGATHIARANGARGYPDRPASDEALADKFLTCARRVLPEAQAENLLARLRQLETVDDIRTLTSLAAPTPDSAASAARGPAYKP
jgi:2-methylcitrate dehydratase PrpD